MDDASPLTRRSFSLPDRLLIAVDQAFRTLLAEHHTSRPYPAEGIPESLEGPEERAHAAALMRINHSGEVAAQALYHGQALVATSPATRDSLLEAAREENDHLAWCAQRVRELGGKLSLLAPFWYAGSFAIGVLAGLAGDKTSLGFVAETERQVVAHLEGHLEQLAKEDARTRAIIEQMAADEERHGRDALLAGGEALPAVVRVLMKWTARIMTRTAYWI
ncbi:MAG: 2-polyprenyl-3-methyl-6-methoxy-1,4-benzoquinone monooxygenase [Gammaproteobacteria bacterium]|nr:demethoxyubiquinone hydroxylase family protein [Gammaproteobacteria bacterium]